jgi:hypothetical protein
MDIFAVISVIILTAKIHFIFYISDIAVLGGRAQIK